MVNINKYVLVAREENYYQHMARHDSRKIILRRAINGSPAHTKSLASSYNKKHMFHLQFIISELQNFPFKVASSKMSNNKHDSVCHICLRYCTTFVIGCSCYYCLPPVKFKKSFLSGLKRKLFSLDGVRTALFWPNNGH